MMINLSLIQNCNINITNFLKLRNFYFELVLLKGYLRYETITFQTVPSEEQVKNFLRQRKVMFCCHDIQVFVFLAILWFSKSVTPRWVLLHDTRCIFEYMFWTTNHWVTKLGQLIDLSKGKKGHFQESFEQFGRVGISSRSFSV